MTGTALSPRVDYFASFLGVTSARIPLALSFPTGRMENRYSRKECFEWSVFQFIALGWTGGLRDRPGAKSGNRRGARGARFAGQDIARRYFSSREVNDLQTLPPDARAEGFFRRWTRKEAYLKATGMGLQIPLDSFSVSVLPGEPTQFLGGVGSCWHLAALQPREGYAAAVAYDGAPCAIKSFTANSESFISTHRPWKSHAPGVTCGRKNFRVPYPCDSQGMGLNFPSQNGTGGPAVTGMVSCHAWTCIVLVLLARNAELEFHWGATNGPNIEARFPRNSRFGSGMVCVSQGVGPIYRPISVALLLSGVITDGGWSQLAYNGLKELTTYGFQDRLRGKHQHRADGPGCPWLLGRRFRSGHRSWRGIQQHAARSGARLSRTSAISSPRSCRSPKCRQHHVRQHGLLWRGLRCWRTGCADFR